MPQPLYSRGSEWRRWDLQVHTPFSALNNGFGEDFEAYASILLDKALERNIAVIGVTDYFCVEGYKLLRALLDDQRKLAALLGEEKARSARNILLLPNIEFRTTVIVRSPTGQDSRVNFHAIFSNKVPVTTIEEHFLRELKFTAESAPGTPDNQHSLTLDNLDDLGRQLKLQHKHFAKLPDRYVGMMNAVVPHELITEVIERQPGRFKDRVLLVVPADEDLSKCNWDGQGHLTRKLLIQKAHMLFTSNAGTRAFGLGHKHQSTKEYLAEFKTFKPCIHGSDAHTFKELFEPSDGRFFWGKADPTFHGLQQLLHEPASRCFIGLEPETLAHVRAHSTKYMHSVRFSKTAEARAADKWFSGEVPLNHGLVAIIGNKGSGKSALADILGLLGDSLATPYFSFLTSTKFLVPKANLGNSFTATLDWVSGPGPSYALDHKQISPQPESVKYIPQNYLEVICSQISQSGKGPFDSELTQVIFSHVSEEQRLNQPTLDDLVNYLTKEREARIKQITDDLSKLNQNIVLLEGKQTAEFRAGLQAVLDQYRAQLRAHDESKPTALALPDQDPAQQAASTAIREELQKLVDESESLDQQIAQMQAGLRDSSLKSAAADKLLSRLANMERQVEGFHGESSNEAAILGIDTRTVLVLQSNREPILSAKRAAEEALGKTRALLDPLVPGSLVSRRALMTENTARVRTQLDAPNRLYQEYLHQLAIWKKRREQIVGSETDGESVAGAEMRLTQLDAVPAELGALYAQRVSLFHEVFDIKRKLVEDYKGLYASVQQFIDKHPVSQQQGALQFSASIVVDGLSEGLLNMIHQGRRGSFQGEDGRKRLQSILEKSEYADSSGVEQMLAAVMSNFRTNQSDGAGTPMVVREQLKQGVSVEALYDFLYGLTYLKPRFELRWQSKPLSQLSPGERGNILLVFYLLIDRRDVPLIIDQPEENLDNQTIATMLVPAIKYAKQRRQIVMVTHNPNLAVVCDADQIIYSKLDKVNANEVTYISGSLEDPLVAQLIIDVLEGTKPAFDLRDAKYELLELAN